jgi:hypothetical protein
MISSIIRSILRSFFFLLLLTAQTGFSQTTRPDAHYRLISGNDFVRSKNYYLLTLFQEIPGVKKLLSEDEALHTMAAAKGDSLKNALKNCDKDGLCYITCLKFSAAEIRRVGERLRALYRPDNALGKLVKDHVKPSGAYILFQELPAAEMLVRAWEQDAEGLIPAIRVTVLNIPTITSACFTIPHH